MPALRERDIHPAVVDGAVHHQEGVVNGPSLGGVAGLGVGQLDLLGYVVGGEVDGAGAAGGDDCAVVLDVVDPPVVAVADHLAGVGAQLPVVAAGGDLITDQQAVAGLGAHGWTVRVELSDVDAVLLGEVVEAMDGVVVGGQDGHGMAVGAELRPVVDHVEVDLARLALVQPAMPLVDAEGVDLAGA
ncbi:MAG: hypothetical protein R2749_01430 [Acidimicrobiales bacterium]